DSSQSGTDASQGNNSGPGQADSQGDSSDSVSGSAQGGDQSNTSDTGQGGGYSNGGQNQNNTVQASQLDTITSPQQVPSNGPVTPDESSVKPYLADAGSGSSQASDESVQASYSRQPTNGNDSQSIPIGLRDLVKDYFSSLDQNQK